MCAGIIVSSPLTDCIIIYTLESRVPADIQDEIRKICAIVVQLGTDLSTNSLFVHVICHVICHLAIFLFFRSRNQ